MTIEDKDLLQANATIIAGVLIFLTISIAIPSSPDLVTKWYLRLSIAAGSIPFVMSLTFLLMDFNAKEYGMKKARFLTRIGSYYLTGVIFLFIIVNTVP
jgi:hypothetical protein